MKTIVALISFAMMLSHAAAGTMTDQPRKSVIFDRTAPAKTLTSRQAQALREIMLPPTLPKDGALTSTKAPCI